MKGISLTLKAMIIGLLLMMLLIGLIYTNNVWGVANVICRKLGSC